MYVPVESSPNQTTLVPPAAGRCAPLSGSVTANGLRAEETETFSADRTGFVPTAGDFDDLPEPLALAAGQEAPTRVLARLRRNER